jgi:Rrf2 family protein
MKLLTKNTDYAIRALMALAMSDETYISSRKIAETQKLPYQYLRTIIQELIRKELVISKEGVNGGIKLKKDPRTIRIVDIIHIFQGEIELSDCMFRTKICENRQVCVLRSEIKRIEANVQNEFRELTIQALVDKIGIQQKGE